MKKLYLKNIAQLHSTLNYEPLENPLFSITHKKLKENEIAQCKENSLNERLCITADFYSINFKNIISGEVMYGRTKYDCSNGLLLFTGPNQTIVFNEILSF